MDDPILLVERAVDEWSGGMEWWPGCPRRQCHRSEEVVARKAVLVVGVTV
jgi:hypothetical protein